MSDSLGHRANLDDVWQPPATFRDALADTERVSTLLLAQLEGQLLVPVAEIEFIARRLHHLARDAHRALPAEVD